MKKISVLALMLAAMCSLNVRAAGFGEPGANVCGPGGTEPESGTDANICGPDGTEPESDGRKWAVVNTSACFMRAEPDYESSNETQTFMGTVVEVLDSERYWRKISTPDPYVAWTNDLCLSYMTEEEKDAYIAAPKYIVTAEYSHIYDGKGFGARRICDLVMGDVLRQVGGSGKVSARTDAPSTMGDWSGEWTEVMLPSGQTGWMQTSDIADFSYWAESRVAQPTLICNFARLFVGVPYMWGGITVKGFDCSGLTKFVYMMHGILLPRNAREQVLVGEEVPIDVNCMQEGDLLFFGTPATADSPMRIGHVAMYIGDNRIIHASQVVRISSINKWDADYYDREILAVRRILGHVDTGEGIVSVACAMKNPDVLF